MVKQSRSGNPAKRAADAQEAAENARLKELDRKKPPTQRLLESTTAGSVELVRILKGQLPEDVYLHLRAGACGMLFVQAALTGRPSPSEVVDVDVPTMDQIKAQVWEEAAAAYRVLHPGPWPTNPYKRRKR